MIIARRAGAPFPFVLCNNGCGQTNESAMRAGSQDVFAEQHVSDTSNADRLPVLLHSFGEARRLSKAPLSPDIRDGSLLPVGGPYAYCPMLEA